MNILFFLLTFVCLHVSVVAHSVHYLYTMLKPQLGFSEFTAVGLLDGEKFMSYNSSNMKLISEDWIKNIEHEDLWKSMEQDIQGHHDDLKKIIKIVLEMFNNTGVHTLQRMYGCEDHNTTRRYDCYGYNGEDLFSLDLKTGTWTAANDKVKNVSKMWDPNDSQAKNLKNILENECNDQLKKCMSYGRETVERKVHPESLLFQKYSSFPEVVCHATGFFPKELNISWQKNGEDMHEHVELRETLPNHDGAFQKRSILKVSVENLQKHTYTCVIQHSSLEKDLVLPVSERRILRDGGSHGGLIGVIIGVVVALVVLVAVVAGIVIWKKNSGFKPVPPKPASEPDSPLDRTVVRDPAAVRKGEVELKEINGHLNSSNTPGQTA